MSGLRNREFYINAILENLFNVALKMGSIEGGCTYDGEDFIWSYTGGLASNRIFPLNISRDNVNERLSEVIERFREWEAPFNMFISPLTQPENMEEYLKDKGMVYSRKWAGMALDLEGYCPEVKKACDIEIIKVNDIETLGIFARTGGRSFEMPESAWDDFRKVIGNLHSKFPEDVHFYMGLRNGSPIATTYFCKDGDVAGLYLVGTLPEGRRGGIATIMVVHVLKEAIRMGCKLCILHASDMGKGVYEKIGFKEYCTIDIYRNKE